MYQDTLERNVTFLDKTNVSFLPRWVGTIMKNITSSKKELIDNVSTLPTIRSINHLPCVLDSINHGSSTPIREIAIF